MFEYSFWLDPYSKMAIMVGEGRLVPLKNEKIEV